MKIRHGFISNSSSSAFILDLREPAVQEYVKCNSSVALPQELDRRTALAVGEKAVRYAQDWISDMGDYGPGLGQWILEHTQKLGVENTVFVRRSDEGMGGYIEYPSPDIVVAEMEYH